MKWSNLKINKCPKCSEYLSDFSEVYISCKCGFGISTKKFGEITSNMAMHELKEEPVDNQEALNNF